MFCFWYLLSYTTGEETDLDKTWANKGTKNVAGKRNKDQKKNNLQRQLFEITPILTVEGRISYRGSCVFVVLFD